MEGPGTASPVRTYVTPAARGFLLAVGSMGLLLALAPASAQVAPEARIHPSISLLDAGARNVLVTGNPVSPLVTCGDCHDAEYITTHTVHGAPWVEALSSPAHVVSSRPWSFEEIGLPAEWLAASPRGAGGGMPAPGSAEMNCFLCHTPNPANDARLEAFRSGQPVWAPTATLSLTGIVSPPANGEGWLWNPRAFDGEGQVLDSLLAIQGPTTRNCAQCHGVAGDDMVAPVVLAGLVAGDWQTVSRGEIFSPQRISESGVNLVGKTSLTRSWDVHAERLLDCSSCHFSENNPIYRKESPETQPAGLIFDSRRMPLGVYLQRPSHNFAGQSVTAGQSATARQTRISEPLSCRFCHDPEPTHQWLPYAKRHTDALACEVCHTPVLYSVSMESVDWSRLDEAGNPEVTWRGCEAGCETGASDLVRGVEPALLLREEVDGRTRLAPYNLVTSWYWVAGDAATPVDLDLVRRASAGAQSAGLQRAHPQSADSQNGTGDGLDVRGAGKPDAAVQSEHPRNVDAVRDRLVDMGVESPRLIGEIQPYPIHHSVAGGAWATSDCSACHDQDSRLTRAVVLAASPPTDAPPTLVPAAGTSLAGSVNHGEDGALVYQPSTSSAGLYVLGHDFVWWSNLLGILAVVATLVGVAIHGLLRWRASRTKLPGAQGPTEPVYMYSTYERAWHWLQALAIFILLATGIEIHVTRMGILDFALAVRIHNVVGFVVVANALFAAFYHLASGEIQQYLPRPRGFFGQAILQARYYLSGIFRGEHHPFEKSLNRKLNPLQQVTYLAILNVLLPLQAVTGVLIWGAQRWPAVDGMLGGLVFLAPLHAFGAWMFGAFLIMHVYLTTTGPTPLANIQAMVVGWEGAGMPEARERAPVGALREETEGAV
jgi:thiosulfate reductase cytochrome b subunit